MSRIITQKAEENKQISERIKNFMKRFDVSSALKSSNAVTPASELALSPTDFVVMVTV